MGIKSIDELSRKKLINEEPLPKSEVDVKEEVSLSEEQQRVVEQSKKKRIKEKPLPISETFVEKEVSVSEEKQRVIPFEGPGKKRRASRRKIDLFEEEFQKNPKGHYQVWRANLQLTRNFKVILYLHCVNDHKVCYRLSTKLAATPSAKLVMTARNNNN